MNNWLRTTAIIALMLALNGCWLPPFLGGGTSKPQAPPVLPAAIVYCESGPYAYGPDGSHEAQAPAYLNELAQSRTTHPCVAMQSSGDLKYYNYIQSLKSVPGVRGIIRTTERQWDFGLKKSEADTVNFAGIMLSWHSPQEPGEWVQQYVDALQSEGVGLLFDVEYPIWDTKKAYPHTEDDKELAKVWGYDLDNPNMYIEFRCRQIATIVRLIYLMVKTKYQQYTMCIVYSGYPGADYF